MPRKCIKALWSFAVSSVPRGVGGRLLWKAIKASEAGRGGNRPAGQQKAI